jgi:hypothetical protein
MSDTQKYLAVGLLLLLLYYYLNAQPAAASVPASTGTAGGIDLGAAQSNPGYDYGLQGNNYSGASPYTGSQYGTSGGTQGGVLVSDPGGDVDTLARVIYGEARGQGEAGMQAVASVVMNRVNNIGLSFGQLGGVSGVCLKPLQFTCMSSQYGGADYTRTMAVQAGDPTFDACLTMAEQAIAGNLPDNTDGALYYYATSISAPRWASSMVVTVQIGTQIFMKPASLLAGL